MSRILTTIDGNEAVAHVAYRINEVIAIYPITPSSPMGELSDAWSSATKPNIWGTVPSVIEMQSEGGAAGVVHGSLQTGSLTTTFTASQGLLLMIPNMYKIAGELTPMVIHVAARALAAQGLSIFGDHSDVMATRATGFAMLCSGSVQEAMDFALISQAISLQSRLPFLHFFDGFRTSHEEAKVELLTEDDMRAMIDLDLVLAHRSRGLSPDHPVIRGTAQNPDVYFQARESVNPFYNACPDITQEVMDKFAGLTGRSYRLFDYHGAPDAERVIVLMGSGAEVTHETIDYLNQKNEKVGVLKVRLYRPFDVKRFVGALPATTKAIAVLDRTKEPGSLGEPLYLDCVSALHEGISNNWCQFQTMPKIVGGRYGLASREFTPAMVKGVFDNLAQEHPKNHFTIGIHDDLTQTSLPYDESFSTEPDEVVRALFYGLGADGTVGANKNSIKIIGENTDHFAQGYFVYDSKKSGAITVSHLRFGPHPIRSSYLITKANFVACHQPIFLERYDMLEALVPGGTFLLNSPVSQEEIWDRLPRTMQEQMIEKQIRFFVIDATKVARDSGMGNRINTVMQVCFFALSGVLAHDEAIAAIKAAIKKSYSSKGEEVVARNVLAVDQTLSQLFEVKVPSQLTSDLTLPPPVSPQAPPFVRDVLGKMIATRGTELPVSVLPCDGTYPTGTAKWEKRNLAFEIPVWDPQVCIQCGKCAMVCPHSVIRIKVYDDNHLSNAPNTFKSCAAKDREWNGQKYTIQVAPEDCTGCGICVDVCPAKNKSETRLKAINMLPQPPLREQERENWNFFLTLPETDRRLLKISNIRQQQLQEPLFEFSGACSGCGETPYIKLVTQLFGDRALIANATGCSSIYGGNLPTTPYTTNAEGRGPAWANSLFEDNAEFGLGFRVSLDKQTEFATQLLKKLAPQIGDDLVHDILQAVQKDEAGIYEQRERIAALKDKLISLESDEARQLQHIADLLVRKSVWIIGGDGWAYDIGYGGLDHVLASGRNVNILVLDTEVYSNTGGQMSKATPRAAVAKFAAGGKPAPKKDLGLIAMTYGNVYVARVAMGARDEHTLKAFLEAEAYDGPSLIIAYSHCIAHGINMTTGMQNQKAAVDSGQWLLYRFNPDREQAGENPLQLDSRAPKIPLEQYLYQENRFKMLTKSHPEDARQLLKEAQDDVYHRWHYYEYLAARKNKQVEAEEKNKPVIADL
ncbi:MAG: pyruvate:ferredoxin (flavodoxin) oxidoreductase [Acidobacteria bacterium]|nr:pyruvate:ferredoxin (flavodoxin) oxidoreductase [Acidobacteriota bacterium]